MRTTKNSKFVAGARTFILMAALSGVLIGGAYLINGAATASVFLFIALGINFFSYFFSDKIVIKMTKAERVTDESNPKLMQMMRELSSQAKLPTPKIYVMHDPQANAFATGRNHKNSSVVFTSGIIMKLSDDELRGVASHELAHIKHYDILTQSVASALGTAITYLAYTVFWFGGGNNGNNIVSLLGTLLIALIAPLAATMIQMAVSRQREYAADAEGAQITNNPESLASALLRISESVKANPMESDSRTATESMFIISPFKSKGLSGMFSTHPPIEERVKRLREMRPTL